MTARNGRKSLAQMTALSKQQAEACRMMSEGFTGKKIAQALGIREATLSRWHNYMPAFREKLGELNAMKWAQSSAMTSKSAEAAIILASRTIADEKESMKNRLQACSLMLNHKRQLMALQIQQQSVDVLQRRLDALEERYREAHAVDIDSYQVHELSPAV